MEILDYFLKNGIAMGLSFCPIGNEHIGGKGN